ncbi:MAG: hypothetical protein Kow0065_08210 [Methylomicrobium sp.]
MSGGVGGVTGAIPPSPPDRYAHSTHYNPAMKAAGSKSQDLYLVPKLCFAIRQAELDGKRSQTSVWEREE